MNSDLLHEIADRIEAEPEHYDQDYYSMATDCGTSYCVAGWAIVLAKPEMLVNGRIRFHFSASPHDIAAKLLGIDGDEAHRLFCGASGPLLGHTVPEALHKLAEMGEVSEGIWGWVDDDEPPS